MGIEETLSPLLSCSRETIQSVLEKKQALDLLP